MTHCSNLVGEINPVRKVGDLVHAAGGILLVDGVSYAPHGLPDVTALGSDVYLFSSYKTYGPHQGVMVIRKSARDRFAPQAHYFNHDNPMKWIVPAGPDHAQMAAANGVMDYFDALDAHHGGADDAARPRRVEKRLRDAESPHIKTMLDYIAGRHDIRLIGPATPENKAATISFTAQNLTAHTIGQKLADHGIMAGAGHYYAARLMTEMGLDPDQGAVRLSFVHYTTADEITRAIEALDHIL
jgi:selenocysteine lyase/cysteine desulfurase